MVSHINDEKKDVINYDHEISLANIIIYYIKKIGPRIEAVEYAVTVCKIQLQSFIENLFNGKNNVIILGNFNLNLMPTDKSKMNIIETLCNLYGLKQCIQEYTTVTDSSSTLICPLVINLELIKHLSVTTT